MIKMNSYVRCGDNKGVADVKVIQVFGNKNKREAKYGDKVYIVVKSWDRSSGSLTDEKQRKKFRRGSLHKAVIVHLKKKVKRVDSTWMWFNSNSIVLIDKKGKPLAKRIKAPIPKEIALQYPTIASISSIIV